MRILHTADWHLGKTLEGRSRLPEQKAFLDELYDIVQEEDIDVVLLAGDAFDTVNPSAVSEQLFYESIARIADEGRVKVIVISGNHDHPDRLAAASPLAEEHGITLVGKPVFQSYKFDIPKRDQQLHLAALPYPSESRLQELLVQSPHEELLQEQYQRRVRTIMEQLTANMTQDTVNMATSHLFVAGGASSDSERPIEVGGAYTVDPSVFPDCLQYVALGHLHRPQTMRSHSHVTRYSGSPLAYSFSETGYAKSVTIIDAQPGEDVHWREIPLSSGKPLVKWQAKEGLNQVYQWIEEGKDKHAWVDLELHVSNALSMEEIHRLRQLHDGFIQIRPVFDHIEDAVNTQRREHIPIDELFAQFYERQTGGAKPEEELTQLFLTLIQEEEA
ncbi:exonuclease subunit SbcD [Caldalkalibacillus salinus]|uniref:exonuclease subunit SbcD n=1 Tax=Caldalkalibacillus salinus TaxID=2803787 RepID=UPI0019215BB7